MDKNYLLELIQEAKKRGGGLLLNSNDKPEVVVLTIERYNQLLDSVRAADENAKKQAEGELSLNTPTGMKIFVTGGAGYIGAHVARQLINAGYEVVILDNLSSGKRENLHPKVKFIEGDLGDANLMRDVFAAEKFDAVIHLAASVEVEESVRYPEQYLMNNAINTLSLLSVMNEYGVKKLVFSSTAAVYGQQEIIPIKETAKLQPDNPYGYSKLLAESFINFYCSYFGFSAVVFRYFNACGNDFDGSITPTHSSHLLPNILIAARGDVPQVVINGGDYETFDGSCVRDYVHVLDIARAHVLALKNFGSGSRFDVYNIGTGKGFSVKQVINKVAEVLNKIIPMQVGPRRPGDAPETVADNSKILKDFNFKIKYSDLETIIQTSWNQMAKSQK